jgi:hypothetical protein
MEFWNIGKMDLGKQQGSTNDKSHVDDQFHIQQFHFKTQYSIVLLFLYSRNWLGTRAPKELHLYI